MLQYSPAYSHARSLQGYPQQQPLPPYQPTNTNATSGSSGDQQAFTNRGDGVRRSPPAVGLGVAAAGNTTSPYQPDVPAGAQPHPHFFPPRQSASPHQPNAAVQNTHPNSNLYPMAAPPLPQTPTSQQPQQQQAAAAANNPNNNNTLNSPRSPQSPGSRSREQQRINLLFEINVELLQEVNRLQGEGLGGAISPQQFELLRKQGKGDKMASEEYIQCLRRVQANLAYLMPMAQGGDANNNQSKIPPGPAHMTPPPHLESMQAKYEQLRELFPGWSGMDHRPSQSSASPRPNGMVGAGSPANA